MTDEPRGGARRPLKRVTARSKLPQKKCTGLHLPRKPARKRSNTGSTLREDAPEAVGLRGVVGAHARLLLERRRRGALDGDVADRDAHAHRAEHLEELAVELGHRPGDERQRSAPSVAVLDDDLVIDEVEVDGERGSPQGMGEVVRPRAVT